MAPRRRASATPSESALTAGSLGSVDASSREPAQATGGHPSRERGMQQPQPRYRRAFRGLRELLARRLDFGELRHVAKAIACLLRPTPVRRTGGIAAMIAEGAF